MSIPEPLRSLGEVTKLEPEMRRLLKPLEGVLDDEMLDYIAGQGLHYSLVHEKDEKDTPQSWVDHAMVVQLDDRMAADNFTKEQRAAMWSYLDGRAC